MSERDDKQPARSSPPQDNDHDREEPRASDKAGPPGDIDKLSRPRPLDGFAHTTANASQDLESPFVAPPRIEIVAAGVGQLGKTRVPISVRAPRGTGPSIVARAAPDLFRVVASPNILPTTEELAPHRELVVGFGAQSPGKYEGTLSIRAQTSGYPDLNVPLVGYTSPALAPRPTPSTRYLAISEDVDLGEHVVGSNRLYELARIGMTEPGWAVIHPINIHDVDGARSTPGDDGPLTLKQTTAEAFRKVTWEDMRVSDKVQRILDIAFAPTRAGVHKALVEIPITWADGVTTKQYVRLSGRARPLTKPADERFGEVAPDERAQAEHRELELNGDPEHDFGLVSESASNAAETVAKLQSEGVKRAADAATGYVTKPPAPSVLIPLIETALTMANAGLARYFAGAIARGLNTQAARTLSESTATQAVKERAKSELAKISEPIREGLKSLGKTQVGKVKNSFNPDLKVATPFAGFFEAQREELILKQGRHKQALTNTKFKLQPLLKKQPEVAILAQRANLHALEETAAQAIGQQMQASLSQYLVAVASVGGDDKALNKHLDTARQLGADHAHNYKSGMLRISIAFDDRSIAVSSAKLTGVSRLVAEKLRPLALETLPIPIIVTAKSAVGQGVITRDNAGVIRASGAFPVRASVDPEANKVELARELLQRLLSRSLESWGVGIDHDDVGDHQEQAP